MKNEVLYHFIQFERHASHPIFVDPANNFFSIYGDFGDLSENQKSHVLFELNEMVQYGEASETQELIDKC